MPSGIVSRIVKESGVPGLFEALATGLPATDLKSLLLAAFRERVRGLRAPAVLARSAPLFAPSTVGARLLHTFDGAAFEAAREFEALELSPVCPLGAESALGRVDQNNVISTIRNAEVPGDSTPALALECALRRRGPRPTVPPVRLCASHRVVRMQSVEFPGYTPHFRLFALASAGRDTGADRFEMQHLAEHIRVYLRLFRSLNAAGFHFASPLVEVSDLRVTERLLAEAGISSGDVRLNVRAHIPGSGERFLAGHSLREARCPELQQRLLEPLSAEFPEAAFRFQPARLEGFGYYDGLCLRISPVAPDGERYPIVDGGFTDWTARLLEDRKERLLTSGIGSEFACRRYAATAAGS